MCFGMVLDVSMVHSLTVDPTCQYPIRRFGWGNFIHIARDVNLDTALSDDSAEKIWEVNRSFSLPESP